MQKNSTKKSIILILTIIASIYGNVVPIHSADSEDNGKCIEGNCYDGIGTYDYSDGLVYEGSWANGRPNGYGKLTLKNKESEQIIEGNFSGGNTIGTVLYIKRLKGYEFKYEGEMKNFVFHGEGKITYSDGSTYSGGWIEGKRNGFGKFIYTDGSIYTGEFKDGKKNGHGTFQFSEKEKYEGNFVNDAFDGQGTYYYPDGSKYIGSWKNDQEEGEGILYDSNGNISKKGKWVKGLFANPLNMIIKDSEDIDEDTFYIYTLDVFEYYQLLDKYDTELKRITYTKTKDYETQLSELKKKKKEISGCWFYYRLEKPFSKDASDEGSNDYNIKKNGFIISSKYADHLKSDILLFTREGDIQFRIGVVFKCSSLIADSRYTTNGESLHGLFFLSMGQAQGLKIENNREKCDVHFIFKISGSNEQDQVLYATTVRVIVAHEDTGEVYYDKTFTSNK